MALYLFDREGGLLEARIEDLGTRRELDDARVRRRVQELLAALGPVQRRRIRMAPFRLTRFDTEFGLVPRAPEDPEDEWHATMEPGDFMAFFPPWSSGEYDT